MQGAHAFELSTDSVISQLTNQYQQALARERHGEHWASRGVSSPAPPSFAGGEAVFHGPPVQAPAPTPLTTPLSQGGAFVAAQRPDAPAKCGEQRPDNLH